MSSRPLMRPSLQPTHKFVQCTSGCAWWRSVKAWCWQEGRMYEGRVIPTVCSFDPMGHMATLSQCCSGCSWQMTAGDNLSTRSNT